LAVAGAAGAGGAEAAGAGHGEGGGLAAGAGHGDWAGAEAVAGAAFGRVAFTAVLHAGDKPPTFFCRHSNAALPPGVTPEHFDMKSLRQLERIAPCCSAVTCA